MTNSQQVTEAMVAILTDMVDQLDAEEMGEASAADFTSTWKSIHERAQAVLAALSVQREAPGEAVAWLQWVNGEARSPIGDLYTVSSLGGSVWQVRWNGTPFTGWHSTEQAAQAAAQEHLVRSAALSAQAEPTQVAVTEGWEFVGWQFNSAGGGWRDCHDEVDARLWQMDGKEIRRIYAAAPEPKP